MKVILKLQQANGFNKLGSERENKKVLLKDINKKETYDKLKKKRDVHEKEMREMHEKGNTCVRKEA